MSGRGETWRSAINSAKINCDELIALYWPQYARFRFEREAGLATAGRSLALTAYGILA